MISPKIMLLIGRLANIKQIQNVKVIANGFHSSSTWQIDHKWREKKRLTRNPNAFGPLTNLPDYSYADGRKAPFGVRRWIRIQEQKEIYTTIKKLVGEIDDAVERHALYERNQAENRKAIIDGKLKPKGQCLLSNTNTENQNSN